MRRITLFERPGCHLCEEARAVLDRVGEPYERVDIESDDALFRRYLERIPVVAVDGEEAFELFIDQRALEARLQ